MRRVAIWLGLLAVVAWGMAWAQESVTTGSIFGKVVDPEGKPLPGATVTATSETGVKRSVVTDVNGEFSIPFLTPGRYDVEVRLEGFAPFKAPVTLSLGQRITLNVTLQPGAEVVVTAAPVVDVTSTAVGVSVTDELMRSVPVGRTFASVTYISPQVVSSPASVGLTNPSIAGATGLENTYIVDGVNITNAAYGALGSYSIVFGSLGTGINFDYVKEVQVKAGGYEAEFGEALGGVVNVITKSGGNTFTGDVFGYLQPKALEAKRKHIELVQVPEVYTIGTQQFDVGFDAGGKLVQDKLFWFLAFDPTWVQVERVAPPGFPLSPCGPEEQFCEKSGHTTTRRIYNYAGKLTFNVNPNHILEVSLFGDPGVGDKGLWRRDSFLRDVQENVEEALRFGGHNQVGRWTGMFGSNLLVEAQVANHFDETTEKDFKDIESIIDARSTPSRLYGGLGFVGVDKNRNLQGTLKLTYIVPNLAGRHEFKIGGNFQRLTYEHTTDYTGQQYCFQFVDAATGEIKEKCTTTGNVIRWRTYNSGLCTSLGGFSRPCARVDLRRNRVSPNTLEVSTDYLNFFAQDSWSILPNLTLKLGVRWERQHLKGAGNLAQEVTLSNNWSPRVGFVWDFLNDRKGKIYAYYGRFYEKIPLDAVFRSLSSEESIDIFSVAPLNADPFDWLRYIRDLSLQYQVIEYGATPTIWCDGKSFIDKATGQEISDEPWCKGVKMKAQHVHEFTVGFERQVFEDIVVSARYQRRWIGAVIEDTQLNTARDIFETGTSHSGLPVDFGTFVVTNPSADYKCEPGDDIKFYDPAHGVVLGCSSTGQLFPDPKRDYNSFEFAVTKRFSKNWQVQAAYRYASLRGHYSGLYFPEYGQSDPNITALYDFPQNDNIMGFTYVDGPLPGERLHVARIFGSYSFDFGLNLGLGLSVESGTPLAPNGCILLYGCGMRYLQKRGTGIQTPDGKLLKRTETIFNADVHADYTFKIAGGRRLAIVLDAFNILNRQAATDYQQNVELEMLEFEETGAPTNPDYGRVTARSAPFALRLGLRFSW
jgi:hypothetical protein